MDAQQTPEASVEHLISRITELERTVRYLKDRQEHSDDAGRPPFKRPDHVAVGEHCRIGRGVTLSAGENKQIMIGDRTSIMRGSELLGPTRVGSRVFINRDAYIRSQVSIGDGTSIGPFVALITDSHEIGPASHRAGSGKLEPIVVGEGVWIGANVTVLGGVTIGAGAVVAAGAVVTSDVTPNTLVAGIPARIIRQIESH